MNLNDEQIERYSRHIILQDVGGPGQEKILNAKVLIIGAGGLGCPLILYLLHSGLGNLGIADHDKIELSNLSRQVLFTKRDIGKYKTYVSKKIAKKINNKTIIKTYTQKIKLNNIDKIAKNYPIICDGTDNFESRLLINDYCIKNKKILISSAISEFDGQLFYFDFRKKIPCFRCFMPETPKENLNCGSNGIMTTLAGIAGSLQANEVIKSILKIKTNLNGNMMVFNALNSSFRKVKLSKNPGCKNNIFHG